MGGRTTRRRGQPSRRRLVRALDRVGFPAYWEANAKPRIEKRIAEISLELPKYNIIPVIESYLGFPLPSQTITVYLLAYSEPHGIRITGLRFLTHVSYPFSIVLHNAIHEPMHPPYHVDDPKVHDAIDLLGRDPLVIDKVQHHDPSFGYNTIAGYIEEDSVQALEQLVSEKFGVGRNPCEYWKEQDGGMHVPIGILRIQHDSRVYRRRLRAGVRTTCKREIRCWPQPLRILEGAGWRHACSRRGYLRGLQTSVTFQSRLLRSVVRTRGPGWAAPRKQLAENRSDLLFSNPLPLTRDIHDL